MLSPVVRSKTANLFHAFDQDGDGFWTIRDHEILIERLATIRGWVPGTPDYQALHDFWIGVWYTLKGADTNADSVVSLDEALAFREHFATELIADYAGRLFEVLDADGDGEIGFDEFRDYIAVSTLAPSHAEEVFPRIDANGDGRISLDEWVQIYLEFFTSEDPNAPGSTLWGPVQV